MPNLKYFEKFSEIHWLHFNLMLLCQPSPFENKTLVELEGL